jgi:hypothetical protein
MDDIVPGALQRLREADIVGLAGLASASLGQEYCRSRYVSANKRQGKRLSGAVTIPDVSFEAEHIQGDPEQPKGEPEHAGTPSDALQRFEVAVEVLDRGGYQVVCTCGNQAPLICAHAAALLYQWVNRPYTFSSILPTSESALSSSGSSDEVVLPMSKKSAEPVSSVQHPQARARYAPLPARHLTVNTIGETLTQLGLSELRATAREYGIVGNGLGKQQLVETMIELLSQPEAVRRVVGTLEKPQRQLLAVLALAGGSVNDEELRGLFERFSLANAGTLQDMLSVLQTKLLIVRTSMSHSLLPRLNGSLSPLDSSWYIPQEVYEALPVALPVTPFNVEAPYGKGNHAVPPTLYLADAQNLLADMLLVARALDGSAAEPQEKRALRNSSLPPSGRLPTDGSLALPTPEDQPAPLLIDSLQDMLSRSPAFLRFAVRLLRMANILYKEETWQTNLRILPNAAELLLGPSSQDALHELFTQWLGHASYAELFELVETGIRIRCRATPLNQPALRRGELEQENNEARQELLQLLARVPLGKWVNFSAFARFIYRLHPTFLQHRQRLFPVPHWWAEQEEGHPLQPAQLADWLRVEGRYLAQLIQGPLHWWGISDLAYAQEGQLLAFRLTPLANFLFHGLQSAVPETSAVPDGLDQPVFHVSPRGDLLLPSQAASWPLVTVIEQFAESTGMDQEQLSYRLTPHSLSEAISQGRDPRELLALLERSASQGEDATLRELLVSLERRIAQYGRVRVYTDVALVQTADIAVMQQLTALTSLDEQTIRELQPTLLLLKKQGAERLLEELKRRGQVPLLHEEV